MTQYVEDTTFLLDGSVQTLKSAVDTLEQFGNMSGLKVNSDKSILVGIGTLRGSSNIFRKVGNCRWNEGDDFKLLGIMFNTDLPRMISINYTIALEKNETIGLYVVKRNISTLGRITVLKSIILPHLNYYLRSLPNPTKELLNEINILFINFIWNDKPDRVTRKQVICDYEEGGLKMIDIFKHIIALKVTCVCRLFDSNTGKNCLSAWYLSKYGFTIGDMFKNGD